jgi:hypothetical protein
MPSLVGLMGTHQKPVCLMDTAQELTSQAVCSNWLAIAVSSEERDSAHYEAAHAMNRHNIKYWGSATGMHLEISCMHAMAALSDLCLKPSSPERAPSGLSCIGLHPDASFD